MTNPPTHWWIVDPAGHRAHDSASLPHLPPGWDDLNVVVLNLAATAGDLWVCDNCNDEIPGGGPIPVLDNRALCDPCAIKTGLRRWDGAPVCGCPACTAYVLRSLHGQKVAAAAPWN